MTRNPLRVPSAVSNATDETLEAASCVQNQCGKSCILDPMLSRLGEADRQLYSPWRTVPPSEEICKQGDRKSLCGRTWTAGRLHAEDWAHGSCAADRSHSIGMSVKGLAMNTQRLIDDM